MTPDIPKDALLAAIVHSSDDAIVSKDLNGIVTSWNEAAERLFGYTSAEMIGRPIAVIVAPGREAEMPDILRRVRRGEKVDHYETIRRRKDGHLVEISLTVSPIKNAEGVIVGASKIARDISERKRQQRRIDTLVQEVSHRSRNLLSICMAVVRMTSRETVEEFKDAVLGRLFALDRVHVGIAQSGLNGASLQDLCSNEMRPYQSREGNLMCDGPPVRVLPSVAQAVSLILHELATNAAKYGAWSGENGRVHLAWAPEDSGGVTVTWTESGGPLVRPPTRQSFGTRLIEGQAKQLGGAVSLKWNPEGLHCSFHIGPEGVGAESIP